MSNRKSLAMASVLVALSAPAMQTDYMVEMGYRDDRDDEPPKPKKRRDYTGDWTGCWRGDGVEPAGESRQQRRRRERMERKQGEQSQGEME